MAACDGLVIVARAEPLAHRTLPAFLELVQRSRGERPVRTHGVLVTLPDGEIQGGRWERELRGRLGSKALPLAIPYDEAVGQAAETGRILAAASPDSPAAVQYQHLAEALKLAEDPLPLKKAAGPMALLSAAAALLEPVGASARGAGYSGSSIPAAPLANAPDDAVEIEPPPDLDLPEPDLPTFSGLASVPAPSLTLPAFRPPPAAVGRLATKPTSPEERPVPRPAPRRPSGSGAARKWLLGVGVAVAAGIGLRFVHLPDVMLPVAVGVAVSAGVILLMLLLQTAPEASTAKPRPAVQAALPKAPSRRDADGRKDAAARLAALTRPSSSASPRRPRPR